MTDLLPILIFAAMLSFGTVVYMRPSPLNSTPTWFWQMSWFTGILTSIGAIAAIFNVRPLMLASAGVMIAVVSFYLARGIRQTIHL